jgi:hypothetical protein
MSGALIPANLAIMRKPLTRNLNILSQLRNLPDSSGRGCQIAKKEMIEINEQTTTKVEYPENGS